jgi:hypothetical protein
MDQRTRGRPFDVSCEQPIETSFKGGVLIFLAFINVAQEWPKG